MLIMVAATLSTTAIMLGFMILPFDQVQSTLTVDVL